MSYQSMIQAPSLLITLINMFLEIASAPKVPHPDEPTNSENEYSAFGPLQATAAVQVYLIGHVLFKGLKLYTCKFSREIV